jgi:hypothetical protein
LGFSPCASRSDFCNLQPMHDLSHARLRLGETIEREVETHSAAV